MIYYKKGNDQILLQEIGENKYIKKLDTLAEKYWLEEKME